MHIVHRHVNQRLKHAPTMSRIQLSLLVMDPSMSEQSRGGAEQTILTTSQAGRSRRRALCAGCNGGGDRVGLEIVVSTHASMIWGRRFKAHAL